MRGLDTQPADHCKIRHGCDAGPAKAKGVRRLCVAFQFDFDRTGDTVPSMGATDMPESLLL